MKIALKDSNAQNKADDINDLSEISWCIGNEASCNQEKWIGYLNDNLVLDDASMDTIPADRYTVVFHFTIDTNGSLHDVRIAKDPGFGLGKRVRDVIAQYNDRWEPAVFNGRATLRYRLQPVTFTVEEEGEECEEQLTAELIP